MKKKKIDRKKPTHSEERQFMTYYMEIAERQGLTLPSAVSAQQSLLMIQVSQYRIKYSLPVADFNGMNAPQRHIQELQTLYGQYQSSSQIREEILFELTKFIDKYVSFLVNKLGFPEKYIRDTGADVFMNQPPVEIRTSTSSSS